MYKSLVISWQRQQQLIPCSQFNLSPTTLFSCADNKCARRLTGGQTHLEGIHLMYTSTKDPMYDGQDYLQLNGLKPDSFRGNAFIQGTAMGLTLAQLSYFRPSPPNSRFVPKDNRVPEKGWEVPCIKSVYSKMSTHGPDPSLCAAIMNWVSAADGETTASSSAEAPAEAQTHADNSKMLRQMIKKQLCIATSFEYYKSLQSTE